MNARATASRRSGLRPAIAKIKIAVKDLGIADDDYRLMLERLTGETSSTRCSDAQLGLVLDELKRKGWRPRPAAVARRGSKPRAADHPLARKARALWISLHQLGEVRDPSEAALEAFARRQLGVTRLQWAVPAESAALIEALKAMADRAGWSQDLTGVPPAEHVQELRRRLADALEARR
jgi:phage gp16-like protein